MIKHDDKLRFTAIDPHGYFIECSEHQWNTHILPGHDMMQEREDEVIRSIENPYMIYKSSRSETSRIYFTESSNRGEAYIKTVVETAPYGKSGEVVTAFPTEQIKGGIREDGLLYRRI